ncbi:MAG: DNA (cytosine-5-)-methyltransferase [Verrucomicrobia bacterium]|nr:DNA (cytosine-5-)-methyltransferase [Verrucomicrobiota bacterium]
MRRRFAATRSSRRESAPTSDRRKRQSRLTSAATAIKEVAPPYRVAADVISGPTPDQPSSHEPPSAYNVGQRVPPVSDPSTNAAATQESEDRRDACPTCLDLFCGCGGFSLGLQRAGFRVLAAIDSDPGAIEVFKANLPDVPHALCEDLTQFSPETLAAMLTPHSALHTPHSIEVDVIVGGPPCQGFSKARMRDGANHGSKRFVEDPRRHLYREFLRFVDFFQPRVFVLENVLGLRNAAGGAYFTAVQKEARELGRAHGKPGYRVHSQIEDAWKLGVPQKRCRQLIIGVRNDLPGYFLPELKPAPRVVFPRSSRREEAHSSKSEIRIPESEVDQSLVTSAATVTLGDATGDLPILRAGAGKDERDYDLARRAEHLRWCGDTAKAYLFDVLEIDRGVKLTNHVARPHSDRDLGDFDRLKEGETSAQAMRRGVQFDFPYSKEHFKDRYTRQSRWKPCSTIVAHLSKDGLMFIHPTQRRSLTPREAARIQSFPDWFRFPAARTHAFRLIGNAVPPLVAEAVGLAVKEFLGASAGSSRREEAHSQIRNPKSEIRSGESLLTSAATNRPGAARELERLARLDRRALRALPTVEFLRGWHALLFLFPGLHPDNALDHGDDIEEIPATQLGLPGLEELLTRRHARSGWPVALEPIGREAWRRYEEDKIRDEEFYCVEPQRAALTDNPNPKSEMKPNPDTTLRRLGQNIRARRMSLELTQASLAAMAGCSPSHLSGIERGERSASILCLAQIAKALRTTTESLCEGIDDGARQPRRGQAQ